MKKNLITSLKQLIVASGGEESTQNNIVDVVDSLTSTVSPSFPPTTNLRLMVSSVNAGIPNFQNIPTSTLNSFITDVLDGKVPVINIASGSGSASHMYCFTPRISYWEPKIRLTVKAFLPYVTGLPDNYALTAIWGINITIDKNREEDATLSISTEWAKTF